MTPESGPLTETVRLADGAAEQTVVPGVAPVSLTAREIEAQRLTRQFRRGAMLPPPAGGLFDATARAQLPLF